MAKKKRKKAEVDEETIPVDTESAKFMAVRKELGMTRDQFAERLGLSSGVVIRQKENGQNPITQRDRQMTEMLMKEHRTVPFPPVEPKGD